MPSTLLAAYPCSHRANGSMLGKQWDPRMLGQVCDSENPNPHHRLAIRFTWAPLAITPVHSEES